MSRSNIKITVFEKMAAAGALVFHKYRLFHSVSTFVIPNTTF